MAHSRSTHTVVGILALFGILFTTHAEAQVMAPCAAYWNAQAVFVGRVQGIKRTGAGRVVSFAVLEGFTGTSSNTVDVSTGPAGQRCSFSFAVGREYIVYAERSDNGALTTGRCSGTREVEDAGADLAYARDVQQGKAPVGFIGGRVSVLRRTLAGKLAGPMALPPATTVTVAHGDATETAVTDRGEFRTASRGAGVYRVSVTVPAEFYSNEPAGTVTLRDPRACKSIDFALHHNGQITGRVIDAAGRAVAGLTLELGPDGSGLGPRVVTDRAGKYLMTRIPPGRFVLSVPADPSRAGGNRQARLFHPGVETVASATRVTLTAGQRLDLADFRLPASHSYVSITGVVFDAEGAPAEGARVFLKGVEDNERVVSEPVTADFMGRFVIAARAGVDYRLFAERPRPDGRTSRVDSADVLRLTAADGLKPVRLTLERRY